MIPFGTETVTLLHKSGDTWQPVAIAGASWRQKTVRILMDSAVRYTTETTCRIPTSAPRPDPGDVIVRGACKDSAGTAIELVRLLEKYRPQGAFRVQSVADNTGEGIPLPHYAARGE